MANHLKNNPINKPKHTLPLIPKEDIHLEIEFISSINQWIVTEKWPGCKTHIFTSMAEMLVTIPEIVRGN